MKQHITIKQLDELSDKAKERLREWLDMKIVVGQNYHVQGLESGWIYPLDLPLLSIGQMIEFLDEIGFEIKIETFEKKMGWDVFLDGNKYTPDNYEWGIRKFSNDDICDALWEACVAVLNESTDR